MIKPTPRELQNVVTTLDKKTFSFLLRTLLNRADIEQPLDVPDQVVLYLYEWLAHWNCFKDSQIERILKHMREIIICQLGWMETIRPHSSLLTVTIVERRYVTWTSQREWYDIDIAEFVPAMDYPGVTLITCDVFALLLRKQEWLRRLKGVSDAGRQDHQVGNAETSTAQA